MNKRTLPFSGYVIDRPTKYEANTAFDKPVCTLFGGACDQTFAAFFMWEKILNDNKFARIIELGTGRGHTSIMFLLYVISRDGEFYTFDDSTVKNDTPLKEYLNLASHATKANIFNPEITRKIKSIINHRGQTILFCDCGDKVHEFRTFAPVMKKGDIIAVHDWGRAIKTEWVNDVIANNKLTWLPESIDYETTLTGVFKKG